jgi:hypothetical protein
LTQTEKGFFEMHTQGISLLRFVRLAALAALFFAGGPPVLADTVSTQSFVGTLASSSSIFETTLTLTSAESVSLQTFGFGGGVNGAGTAIAAGGTDPLMAIFNGTGSGATILTDGMGDPYGTSLDLGNYSSFMGCPPAGLVDFGGPTCGDITMSLASLAAGTYTLVLADGQYIPNAIFDNGTLGEGFTDFTGGAFCNLANGSVACPNASGAYALDVTTTSGAVTATPEPATMVLLGVGLLSVAAGRRRRDKPRVA